MRSLPYAVHLSFCFWKMVAKQRLCQPLHMPKNGHGAEVVPLDGIGGKDPYTDCFDKPSSMLVG